MIGGSAHSTRPRVEPVTFPQFLPVARFSGSKSLTHRGAFQPQITTHPQELELLCVMTHFVSCCVSPAVPLFVAAFQVMLCPPFLDRKSIPRSLEESLWPESGPQLASRGLVPDHIFQIALLTCVSPLSVSLQSLQFLQKLIVCGLPHLPPRWVQKYEHLEPSSLHFSSHM